MTFIPKTFLATVFAAAIASPALAHGVHSHSVDLPVIGSGASHEVVIKCSHGYALSGGVKAGDRMSPNGPLMITGSYPKTTRSWAVELTNRSGRPTGAMEASVTVYAMCGYRH
ncbi:hypothetical protein [Pacificoceanicola onchidii]|uniref:hypothetical protein n=1 Tax=Pacificoceanicola onchidii TaxID=2562685 RepID=UPI0010A2B179|nr:hypothetical protein [Pacificoceanicola onchidii]